MYHDVQLYFPDEEVKISIISNVDTAYARNKVLILDEADAMIDEYKIIMK
jgi:hypothetical protein